MTKNNILLVATVAASILVSAIAGAATTAPALDPRDKPYYTHGASYWNGDTQMIWRPGSMSIWGHRWIHGIYVEGQHRKPTANAPKETTPPAKH